MMLPNQNEVREKPDRRQGGEKESGESRCLICVSPKFEISYRDMVIARRKFGDVSDDEWEFLERHVRATVDLVSGIWPNRIPDERFRQMVIADIAQTSFERYDKYEDTYLSGSPFKTLETSR